MQPFQSDKYINQETYLSFQSEKIYHQWIIENMELRYLLSQVIDNHNED
jgi:hypothetical protein